MAANTAASADTDVNATSCAFRTPDGSAAVRPTWRDRFDKTDHATEEEDCKFFRKAAEPALRPGVIKLTRKLRCTRSCGPLPRCLVPAQFSRPKQAERAGRRALESQLGPLETRRSALGAAPARYRAAN